MTDLRRFDYSISPQAMWKANPEKVKSPYVIVYAPHSFGAGKIGGRRFELSMSLTFHKHATEPSFRLQYQSACLDFNRLRRVA